MLRVTVAHDKGKEEAKRIVDQSVDDLLRSVASGPVQILDPHKEWHDSTMTFSFRAKMGLFGSQVHGKVWVEDKQMTIEVEIPGIFRKFISEEKIKGTLESRAKALLTA